VAVGGRMGQFDTALPPNQRACGIGGESGKRVGGEASTFGWLIIGSLPHRIIGIPQYAGESGPDSVRSSASVHHTSAPVIVRESVERSYSGAEEQGGSWRFGSISLWCLEAYPPPPPLSLGASVRVQDPKKKWWDHVGVIVAIGRYHLYRIKFAIGSVLWRIRRFFRFLVPATSAEEAELIQLMVGQVIKQATLNSQPRSNNPYCLRL
jgi:hypothetical protein